MSTTLLLLLISIFCTSNVKCAVAKVPNGYFITPTKMTYFGCQLYCRMNGAMLASMSHPATASNLKQIIKMFRLKAAYVDNPQGNSGNAIKVVLKNNLGNRKRYLVVKLSTGLEKLLGICNSTPLTLDDEKDIFGLQSLNYSHNQVKSLTSLKITPPSSAEKQCRQNY